LGTHLYPEIALHAGGEPTDKRPRVSPMCGGTRFGSQSTWKRYGRIQQRAELGVTERQRSQPQVDTSLVHEALLYQNPEHFGDVVAGFASEAARVREPVLVVLPGPSHDLVRNAAGPSGADLHFEDMSARGRNPACLLDLF